ncbi:MAG: 4-hydroxy-2-oxovalerate aldolase [Verrucomicrobia subdivision 3 bacterium]|nr:4-hydroxy-2-oxovalerate aldolase [Limisphaerales bacterium]MCS1415840.1 4-hydroxy-2-oxovalerate aldolase [Limisphaerales bacterium]
MGEIAAFRRPKRSEFLSGVTIGSWLTIPHPSLAEILGRAGFDWLTVDLEHSVTSLETTGEMIRVIDLLGLNALVRVGSHDANTIKRVMDAGAHGIIASTVNTATEARHIVDAVKYPSKGTRGVGLSRAHGYAQEFDRYYRWLNEESLVIVQIEHIDGVRNMEEIINVPGVDGFFIGPFDLSASLGIPGEFDHPKMVEALNSILQVKEKTGTMSGIHVVQPVPEDLQRRIDEGYQMIAYGVDYLFVSNKAREGLSRIAKSGSN